MFHQTLPLDTPNHLLQLLCSLLRKQITTLNPIPSSIDMVSACLFDFDPNRVGREPGSTGNQTQPFPLSGIDEINSRSLIVKRRDRLGAVPRLLELESLSRGLGEAGEGGEGNRGDMR